jgi:phage N-6-adenine-methyltransferase
MKGANTGKAGRGDWRTPKPIVEKLSEWFGPFGFDAAADADNRIDGVHGFYTIEDDGLSQPWPYDTVVWCNPPWNQCGKWVDKAIDEHINRGVQSVLLLPSSTATVWFKHLFQYAYIMLLHGRVDFDLPPGVTNNHNPDRDVMVAVLSERFPHHLITVWDWKKAISCKK